MIRQRHAAAGAALAVFLILACRDAPLAPDAIANTAPTMSLASDTVEELPGPAQILSAWTEISFYDGSHGGWPTAQFKVGMEYYGNRASMSTAYDITGPGTSLKDKIVNTQDTFYVPWLLKRFEQIYSIPTNKNCELLIKAGTEHAAWWFVYMRGLVNHESTKALKHTMGTPLQLQPCEPPAPPAPPPTGGDDDETSSGGGSSSSGFLIIETCHYWAIYERGVLVGIELRYCEFDTIPIADQ